ncbi:hypothetical protein P261_01214 [Lachnospiraceae bacterium TWA4]|nr:hypothetical protein P261_01214 [Lachnospiraceae bacterium TWA4]
MNSTIYLKVKPSCTLYQPKVYLKDIAEVWCSDSKSCAKVCQLSLGSVSDTKIFSVLELIGAVEKEFPNATIETLGATDVVVTYEKDSSIKKFDYLKAIFACVLSFIGAAFAIMTFNYDGNISEIFKTLTMILTGTKPQGLSVMEISYMIGLPVGILVFFNHFSKLKESKDPTPIEVQMKLYNDNLYQTMAEKKEEK